MVMIDRMVLRRRGALLILILFMLTTFAVTAAITVDYAYMGLVQTELRIATDAAAKAGAEALSRGATAADAKLAAVHYAALNSVARQPLRIRTTDVSVGRLTWDPDGSWDFTPNRTPANAVRVHSQTGDNGVHPAIPLFFGKLLGADDYSPSCTSIAGQQDVAVCLCIDRSGSMCLDMSGNPTAFPPNNPLLSDYTARGVLYQNQISPPHPTGSRWAVLDGAVQLYLDEVRTYSPPPRTGLVTWASDYTLTVPTTIVFEAATLDVPVPSHLEGNWNSNVTHLRNAVRKLGEEPMMGATNLAAGLDMAVAVLSEPEAGAFANKVIILMTDGLWNEGRDPIAAAIDARNAGIVIHTVTMLTDFQQELKDIALESGGRHFMTTNEAELRHAFRELARSLPVVLVD